MRRISEKEAGTFWREPVYGEASCVGEQALWRAGEAGRRKGKARVQAKACLNPGVFPLKNFDIFP